NGRRPAETTPGRSMDRVTDSQVPTVEAVRTALGGVLDPEIHRPITDLGMVKDIQVQPDGLVEVTVYLTIAACPLRDRITGDVTAAESRVPGVNEVRVALDVMSEQQRVELRRTL